MSLNGCFLDAGTLPGDLDWSALTASLDHWQWRHNTARDERVAALDGVDVAVTNKVVLDAEVLAQAASLKLICIAATGVNNVDLDAARERDFDVVNVAGYATEAVCQHVFAFILGRATRWADYDRLVKNGGWTESEFFCRLDYPIENVAGQTLAIIGGGDTGQAVAAVGRALGMTVRLAERPRATTIRSGRTPFDDALTAADVVTLHCPLTDDTRHLINADTLARMKSTAMLVNTARGGVVDANALADALRAGTIAAAGVDVLDAEPPPADHPLLAADVPNLMITPHTGWASRQARQRVLDQVAANIEQFRDGGSISPVNAR